MPTLSLLLVCMLSFAPTAQADDALDEVLTAMVKLKVLDPAIQDAREMLGCLVANNGNANACFNIPTEAEKQAGKAAAKFMPDDPKIQGVVKLVVAVQKEQWLTVIEIAGLDILAQLICENATRVGGPVGSWFCSDPFQKVINTKVKPVAEEVFRLINGGSLNVAKFFELVALLANLDLACELIPNEIPGVGEACGLLGKIIAEIGGLFVDAAKYGAKIVVSTADDVEDIIFGSDAHMPYDKYYGLYWLPWLHKSVDLCVTSNCAGTGKLNQNIWNACVDYFDAHNQYRSTAKKTCDDMRDKRYLKAYDLLSKAILNGAHAYVGTIRAGAKAWAISEYGKNNDTAIRSHFLTLCETELEQGYPLSSGNPAMCDAYTSTSSPYIKNANSYIKPLFEALRDKCLAQVKAQQVSPTAWRNACKKAEPDFIAMLQGEQKALQNNISSLVSEGCAPPQGWSAQQGLRFQCQTYSGYDHCMKAMVVGANSICSVDRNKADAARAKEILGFLGNTRCSLSGNEVLCRRPWKRTQCQQLIKGTPAIQLSKTALSCKEDSSDYYKIAFANQALLEELNHPIARSGQGPRCSLIEDKAKIKCLQIDDLENRLAAKPEFQRPECKSDPDYDGSDVSCYLKPYNKNTAPKQNTASVSSTAVPTIQQPGGNVVRDTPLMTTVPVTPPGRTEPDPTAAPARTAAPAIRAMNAQPDAALAPPNPCRMTVNYYVPQAPIVSVSSTRLLVNDQFQIQCSFKKETREVEWPGCDAAARTSMQILKGAKESGSRYSGIVAIDGNTVGVSSSPEDGSDFASAKIWKFDSPGAHEVSCQVDNALRFAAEGAPTYLNSSVSFDVSARSDGLTYRSFEPKSAATLSVRPLPSEAVPTARDGRFRVLQPAAPAEGDDVPAVAEPAARTADRLAKTPTVESADPNASVVPWDRTLLYCFASASGPKFGDGRNYEIHVRNNSAEAIETGKTIFWRLYGSWFVNGGFGGKKQKKWTQGESYALEDALPIGATIPVAKISAMGTVFNCEAWAQ